MFLMNSFLAASINSGSALLAAPSNHLIALDAAFTGGELVSPVISFTGRKSFTTSSGLVLLKLRPVSFSMRYATPIIETMVEAILCFCTLLPCSHSRRMKLTGHEA